MEVIEDGDEVDIGLTEEWKEVWGIGRGDSEVWVIEAEPSWGEVSDGVEVLAEGLEGEAIPGFVVSKEDGFVGGVRGWGMNGEWRMRGEVGLPIGLGFGLGGERVYWRRDWF